MQFLLPLVLLGGMMFMMTRSQKKQQQERQNQLDSMQVGSSVVTIGGLHGEIAEINTEKSTVVLDCEGIFLEFNKTAIATIKPPMEVANDDIVETVEVPEMVETIEEPIVESEEKE